LRFSKHTIAYFAHYNTRMRPTVFIDGHAGTTGLRIREWLAARDDVEVVSLPDGMRKDAGARREQMLDADLSVLCLPDAAAREAIGWLADGRGRILDASSAHRVAGGWTYGLPELAAEQGAAIGQARRVANPGCYATAFILLVRPLVDAGLLPEDAPLAVHALSGYSGGGHSLIERWEARESDLLRLRYEAPYALDRMHKHVPEMVRYGRLGAEPQFVPAVGPFRCGMRVEIPLPKGILPAGAGGTAAWGALSERYADRTFVRVLPLSDAANGDERSLDPEACNDTNRIDLHVLPHPSGHLLLVGILDNLGKGASGAAVQNLNLMLGLPEERGLVAARAGAP